MIDPSTLEFVRSGLERYPDARATVAFFEDTISKAIISALQQQPWRTFQPNTSPKGGLAISKGKGDTFLQAWLEGSTRYLGGRVRYVYLGVYWENPVVAAVGIFDERWRKLPLRPPVGLSPSIQFAPSDQSLGIELGQEFQPEVDFRNLLDALEGALEAD